MPQNSLLAADAGRLATEFFLHSASVRGRSRGSSLFFVSFVFSFSLLGFSAFSCFGEFHVALRASASSRICQLLVARSALATMLWERATAKMNGTLVLALDVA